MRFCPFCSAENEGEASHCSACARKLPPLPPRQKRITKTLDRDESSETGIGLPAGASVSVGIATKRTKDEVQKERRVEDEPARRVSDLEVAPPVPTREQRDIDATAEAVKQSGVGGAIATELADDGSAAHHWPAPAPPEVAADPHDWNADDSVPRTATDHPALGHRPIAVAPVPEVPEAGMLGAARYTVAFVRARWQRRRAIAKLREAITGNTNSLDDVLGRLGAETRALEIRTSVLATENEAIDAAEKRRRKADHACAELSNRQAEENARFADIERDRQNKVDECEKSLAVAENDLASLEAQRRALRDKRKALERKQKNYIKAAEERSASADKAQLGEQKEELRRKAKEMRKDAADLEPEKRDIDRRIEALDKPKSQALARLEAIKAELDSARRGLNDAKEGHRLRLAEIEAEQGRRSKELAQADAEIQRRLITLGTLVNLNRIERPEFREHYAHIDRLRGAIGSRANEIDRLSAEREAYDRSSIVRGCLVIGGMLLILMTFILILVAVL